jgi:glycosyltransferase involved in cell wall biosynthesis
LLREQQFDVVHSQVLYYSGFILRLAAQCRTPIRVAQLHNTHDGRRAGLGRTLVRTLMRHWIDRYATNIVAVSEAVMIGIWGPHWRSDPRCQVVYNGVETSAFEGKPDRDQVRHEFNLPTDALLCIHVGRMLRQKNHLRLTSMFHEILKRQPAARLLLVGQGDNEIERCVRKRTAELGIQDRVVLSGERSDVPRLLKAADMLILPSLWEGLPGVVQEACLADTPVVASDLPGTREIAARLPGIRLVALDTSDQHWAQVVDATLREQKSADSREHARRAFEASEFTIDRCTETNCRIWRGQVQRPVPLQPECLERR